MLYNTSFYLKEGPKTYNIEIYFDNNFYTQLTLHPDVWYNSDFPNDLNEIKLINNY